MEELLSQKINSRKLAKQMEILVEKGLKNAFVPMEKGDKIYIGNVVISKQDNGFTVVDKSSNIKLAKTFFKNSAIAYAKNYCLKKPKTGAILKLDAELEKHYMNSLFYRNTIKKSNNSATVFAAETRLDITKAKTSHLMKELKRYIFY